MSIEITLRKRIYKLQDCNYMYNCSNALLHGLINALLLLSFVSVTGSLNCNFDVGSCGWTQDRTDDFDWTRKKGASPTALTGPRADHTSGSM